LLPHADVSKLTTPYQLSELADQLVSKLILHCPRGPYHIGGLCLSGVLAFEVARQLIARARGRLLVCLTPPPPHSLPCRLGKITGVIFTIRRCFTSPS
jgi:thioesterase domain-containing protein